MVDAKHSSCSMLLVLPHYFFVNHGKEGGWGKGNVVSAGPHSLSQLPSLTQRVEELWILMRGPLVFKRLLEVVLPNCYICQ